MSAPRKHRLAVALAAGLLFAASAQADWLAPDASFRDAQMQLRYATRDTAGHGDDVARLDTLATALLRLGRVSEARKLFERTLATKPGNPAACAALGKLALWADRTSEAESLLTLAGPFEGAATDLYASRLRRGAWSEAATQCADLGDDGRLPLLERLAAGPDMAVQGERAQFMFERIWPAPIVRVKLNGTLVLMVLDTGTPGVLIDASAMKRAGVTPLAGQRLTPWDGTRVAARNAIIPKLQIGDITLTNVPAAALPLRKLSLAVNPQAEEVAGVIGMSVLRRFDVTFDYKRRRIEFAPHGTAAAFEGSRVPFDVWGECSLVVWGSANGGRRMAMSLASGLPEAGVGAPESVFEELGLKPGGVSRVMKGAGSWLQGRAWAAVNVPALALGSVAFDKLSGWSGAMEPIELWREGVRKDALLGPGVFLGRRVSIDWQRHELVFED
ncbi:MAG: aspartyl protease family protein [Candidatus Eisenbacteria bacterium]